MKLPKINPAILDHYIRHFESGFLVAIPFVWDAIEKFQASGHQLHFDRMTIFGVASVAVAPAITTLYGRYVKKYPHLQPEIQFVANDATKFLEDQLAQMAKPSVAPVVVVQAPQTAPVAPEVPAPVPSVDTTPGANA